MADELNINLNISSRYRELIDKAKTGASTTDLNRALSQMAKDINAIRRISEQTLKKQLDQVKSQTRMERTLEAEKPRQPAAVDPSKAQKELDRLSKDIKQTSDSLGSFTSEVKRTESTRASSDKKTMDAMDDLARKTGDLGKKTDTAGKSVEDLEKKLDSLTKNVDSAKQEILEMSSTANKASDSLDKIVKVKSVQGRIPEYERTTLLPGATYKTPDIHRRTVEIDRIATDLAKSLKKLQKQILESAIESPAIRGGRYQLLPREKGGLGFELEKETQREFRLRLVNVDKLISEIQKLDKTFKAAGKTATPEEAARLLYKEFVPRLEAEIKTTDIQKMADAIAQTLQRREGRVVTREDIFARYEGDPDKILQDYLRNVVDPKVTEAIREVTKTIAIPAVKLTERGTKVIETRSGAERGIMRFAEFERGVDRLFGEIEKATKQTTGQTRKALEKTMMDLRRQLVPDPQTGRFPGAAQLNAAYSQLIKAVTTLNQDLVKSGFAKAIAAREAKAGGGVTEQMFQQRIEQLSSKTIPELEGMLSKLGGSVSDVVTSLNKLNALNIYDVISKSLTEPVEGIGEAFDKNFWDKMARGFDSAFRDLEERINKVVQQQPVTAPYKPKLGVHSGTTVGVLTTPPQVARGQGVAAPRLLLPHEAKAAIIKLNEEIRDYLDDLAVTGRLAQSEFKHLSTIGQSESIASSIDRIEELNKALFKMSSIDLRQLGPLGEQFANLGRTLQQAQAALSGPMAEFPTLRGATEQRLIERGAFGQKGFGYNVLTELRHTAGTFEDQIEIAGKLAKVVSEATRKLILPGPTPGGEVTAATPGVVQETSLAIAKRALEEGREIPVEVAKEFEKVGQEIIRAFGDPRYYEYAADRATIEKVVQAATTVRGQDVDIQIARIAEEFVAQWGRKLTTRFAAKGVSTFGIPEAAAGGARLRVAEDLGTARIPKTLGMLASELLEKQFGKESYSELKQRLVDSGNKFFISLFTDAESDIAKAFPEEAQRLRDTLADLNEALGTAFKPTPDDIRRFREMFMKSMGAGQEALFKEAPIEARLSARGVARRGLQADVLEPFVNNLTGAVETVLPDKIDIERWLGTQGIGQFLEALGFEKNIEEIKRLEKEHFEAVQKNDIAKAERLKELIELEKNFAAYTQVRGRGPSLVGQKFLEIVEEPTLKRPFTEAEIETGMKGERLNLQAFAALSSIFGTQSEYMKEIAEAARPAAAEARELITAIALLSKPLSGLKEELKDFLPAVEVTTKELGDAIGPEEVRYFEQASGNLEDIKDTVLDIAKFPSAFFLKVPEQAGGGRILVPGAEARKTYPEELLGGRGPTGLTRQIDQLVGTIAEINRITSGMRTGTGEMLTPEQIQQNAWNAVSELVTRITNEWQKSTKGQTANLESATQAFQTLLQALSPTRPTAYPTLRGTERGAVEARFSQALQKAQAQGMQGAQATLNALRTAALAAKDVLVGPTFTQVEKTLKDIEEAIKVVQAGGELPQPFAARKGGFAKFRHQRGQASDIAFLEFFRELEKQKLTATTALQASIDEGSINALSKTLGFAIQENSKQALDDALRRFARARARYAEELGKSIFGKQGAVERAFFERQLPAVRGQVVSLEVDKIPELNDALKAMRSLERKFPNIDFRESIKELTTVIKEAEERRAAAMKEGRPFLREGEVAISPKKAELLKLEVIDEKTKKKVETTVKEMLEKGEDIYLESLRFPVTGAPSFQAVRARLMGEETGFAPGFGENVIALAGRPGYDIAKTEEALQPLRDVVMTLRDRLDELNEKASQSSMVESRVADTRKQLHEQIKALNNIIDKATAQFAPFEQNLDFDGDAIFLHAAATEKARKEIEQHYKAIQDLTNDIFATRRSLFKATAAIGEKDVDTLAKIAEEFAGKFAPEKGFAFLRRPHIEKDVASIQAKELDMVLKQYMGPDALKQLADKLGKPMEMITEAEKRREVFNQKIAEDITKHLSKLDIGMATESINRIARAAEIMVGFGGGLVGGGGRPPMGGFTGRWPAGAALGPDPAREFQFRLNELLRFGINAALKTKHGGEPIYREMAQLIAQGPEAMWEEVKKGGAYSGLLKANKILEETVRDRLRGLSFEEIRKEAERFFSKEGLMGKGRAELVEMIISKVNFKGFFEELFNVLRDAAIKAYEVQILKSMKGVSALSKEQITQQATAQFETARAEGRGIDVLNEITKVLEPLYTLRTSTIDLDAVFRQLEGTVKDAPEWIKQFQGQRGFDEVVKSMAKVQVASDYLADSIRDVTTGVTASADAMTKLVQTYVQENIQRLDKLTEFAREFGLPTKPGEDLTDERLRELTTLLMERRGIEQRPAAIRSFMQREIERLGVRDITKEERGRIRLTYLETLPDEIRKALEELPEKEREAIVETGIAFKEATAQLDRVVKTLQSVEFQRRVFEDVFPKSTMFSKMGGRGGPLDILPYQATLVGGPPHPTQYGPPRQPAMTEVQKLAERLGVPSENLIEVLHRMASKGAEGERDMAEYVVKLKEMTEKADKLAMSLEDEFNRLEGKQTTPLFRQFRASGFGAGGVGEILNQMLGKDMFPDLAKSYVEGTALRGSYYHKLIAKEFQKGIKTKAGKVVPLKDAEKLVTMVLDSSEGVLESITGHIDLLFEDRTEAIVGDIKSVGPMLVSKIKAHAEKGTPLSGYTAKKLESSINQLQFYMDSIYKETGKQVSGFIEFVDRLDPQRRYRYEVKYDPAKVKKIIENAEKASKAVQEAIERQEVNIEELPENLALEELQKLEEMRLKKFRKGDFPSEKVMKEIDKATAEYLKFMTEFSRLNNQALNAIRQAPGVKGKTTVQDLDKLQKAVDDLSRGTETGAGKAAQDVKKVKETIEKGKDIGMGVGTAFDVPEIERLERQLKELEDSAGAAAAGGAGMPPGGGGGDDDDPFIRFVRKRKELMDRYNEAMREFGKAGEGDFEAALDALENAGAQLQTLDKLVREYHDSISEEKIKPIIEDLRKKLSDVRETRMRVENRMFAEDPRGYVKRLRPEEDRLTSAPTGNILADIRLYQEAARRAHGLGAATRGRVPKDALRVLDRIEKEGTFEKAPAIFREALREAGVTGVEELNAWKRYHLAKTEYLIREAERWDKAAKKLEQEGRAQEAIGAESAARENIEKAQRAIKSTFAKRLTTPYLTPRGKQGTAGRYIDAGLAESAGVIVDPEDLKKVSKEYKEIRTTLKPIYELLTKQWDISSLEKAREAFRFLSMHSKEMMDTDLTQAWNFEKLARQITILRGALEQYLFINVNMGETQRQNIRETIAFLKDLEKTYARLSGETLREDVIKVPKWLTPEEQRKLHERNLQIIRDKLERPIAEVVAETGDADMAFKQIGETLNYTMKVWDSAGNVVDNQVFTFRKLNDQIVSTGEVVGRFTEDVNDMQAAFAERRGIGQAFRRVILWGTAATVTYGTVRALQDMVDTIANVEIGMVQLRKVMNPIITDFKEIQRTGVQFAKEFGVPIENVIESMRVFAQQGLNQVEVLDRARTSTLAANVTTLEAQDATEALTSATKQFTTEGRGSIRFLDAWIEVAARHAITSKDLALAIQRAGAAAKNAGIDFDELNAIVTAIGAVSRRTGREIGTSVRFFARRLTAQKAPAELAKVGIAAFTETGDIRRAFDILDELAMKWEDLTQAQRLNIAMAIGGRRHYNAILILMNNWQEALAALEHSQNSQGSAMRRNQIVMESFRKKMEQLNQSVVEAQLAFGELALPTAKKFIDSLRFLVERINEVPRGIKIAALALGSLFVLLKKGAPIVDRFADVWHTVIAAGTGDFASGAFNLIDDIKKALSDATTAKNIYEVDSALGKLAFTLVDLGRSFNAWIASVTGFAGAVSGTVSATSLLAAITTPLHKTFGTLGIVSLGLTKTLNFTAEAMENYSKAGTGVLKSLGPLIGPSVVLDNTLVGWIQKFYEANKSAQDFAEGQKNVVLQMQENIKQTKEYISAVEKLNELSAMTPMAEEGRIGDTAASRLEERLMLERELGDLLAKNIPSAVRSYDEFGYAVVDVNEALSHSFRNLKQVNEEALHLKSLEISQRFLDGLTQMKDSSQETLLLFKEITSAIPIFGETIAGAINVAPAVELEQSLERLNKLLAAQKEFPLAPVFLKPIEEARKGVMKARQAFEKDLEAMREAMALSPKGATPEQTLRRLKQFSGQFELLAKHASAMGGIEVDWQDILATEFFRKEGVRLRETAEQTFTFFTKELKLKAKKSIDEVRKVFETEEDFQRAITEGLVDRRQFTLMANDIVLFTKEASKQLVEGMEVAAGTARIGMERAVGGELETFVEFVDKKTEEMVRIPLENVSERMQRLALAIFSPTDFEEAVRSSLKSIDTILAGAAAGIQLPKEIDLGARFFSQIPAAQLLATRRGIIPGAVGAAPEFGFPEIKETYEVDYNKYVKDLREYNRLTEELTKIRQDDLNAAAKAAPALTEEFERLQKILMNDTAVMNYRVVLEEITQLYDESARRLQNLADAERIRQATLTIPYGPLAGVPRQIPTAPQIPTTIGEATAEQVAAALIPEFTETRLAYTESLRVQEETVSIMSSIKEAQRNLTYLKSIYDAFGTTIPQEELTKYFDEITKIEPGLDKNTQAQIKYLRPIKESVEDIARTVSEEAGRAPEVTSATRVLAGGMSIVERALTKNLALTADFFDKSAQSQQFLARSSELQQLAIDELSTKTLPELLTSYKQAMGELKTIGERRGLIPRPLSELEGVEKIFGTFDPRRFFESVDKLTGEVTPGLAKDLYRLTRQDVVDVYQEAFSRQVSPLMAQGAFPDFLRSVLTKRLERVERPRPGMIRRRIPEMPETRMTTGELLAHIIPQIQPGGEEIARQFGIEVPERLEKETGYQTKQLQDLNELFSKDVSFNEDTYKAITQLAAFGLALQAPTAAVGAGRIGGAMAAGEAARGLGFTGLRTQEIASIAGAIVGDIGVRGFRGVKDLLKGVYGVLTGKSKPADEQALKDALDPLAPKGLQAEQELTNAELAAQTSLLQNIELNTEAMATGTKREKITEAREKLKKAIKEGTEGAARRAVRAPVQPLIRQTREVEMAERVRRATRVRRDLPRFFQRLLMAGGIAALAGFEALRRVKAGEMERLMETAEDQTKGVFKVFLENIPEIKAVFEDMGPQFEPLVKVAEEGAKNVEISALNSIKTWEDLTTFLGELGQKAMKKQAFQKGLKLALEDALNVFRGTIIKEFDAFFRNLQMGEIANEINREFRIQLSGFLEGFHFPGAIEPGRPAPMATAEERVFAAAPGPYRQFVERQQDLEKMLGRLADVRGQMAQLEDQVMKGGESAIFAAEKLKILTDEEQRLSQDSDMLVRSLQGLKGALDQAIYVERLRIAIEDMMFELKKSRDILEIDRTSIQMALGQHPLAEVQPAWEDRDFWRAGMDQFELEMARIRKEKGFLPIAERERIEWQRKEALIAEERNRELEKFNREVQAGEQVYSQLYDYQNKYGIDVQNLMEQIRNDLERAGEVVRRGGREEFRGIPSLDMMNERLAELAQEAREKEYEQQRKIIMSPTEQYLRSMIGILKSIDMNTQKAAEVPGFEYEAPERKVIVPPTIFPESVYKRGEIEASFFEAEGEMARGGKAGKVQGPGTPTSDSISMSVTPGSFIMKASSSKKLSPFLDAMLAGETMPTKGGVPIRVSRDEYLIPPDVASNVGYDNLYTMNETGMLPDGMFGGGRMRRMYMGMGGMARKKYFQMGGTYFGDFGMTAQELDEFEEAYYGRRAKTFTAHPTTPEEKAEYEAWLRQSEMSPVFTAHPTTPEEMAQYKQFLGRQEIKKKLRNFRYQNFKSRMALAYKLAETESPLSRTQQIPLLDKWLDWINKSQWSATDKSSWLSEINALMDRGIMNRELADKYERALLDSIPEDVKRQMFAFKPLKKELGAAELSKYGIETPDDPFEAIRNRLRMNEEMKARGESALFNKYIMRGTETELLSEAEYMQQGYKNLGLQSILSEYIERLGINVEPATISAVIKERGIGVLSKSEYQIADILKAKQAEINEKKALAEKLAKDKKQAEKLKKDLGVEQKPLDTAATKKTVEQVLKAPKPTAQLNAPSMMHLREFIKKNPGLADKNEKEQRDAYNRWIISQADKYGTGVPEADLVWFFHSMSDEEKEMLVRAGLYAPLLMWGWPAVGGTLGTLGTAIPTTGFGLQFLRGKMWWSDREMTTFDKIDSLLEAVVPGASTLLTKGVFKLIPGMARLIKNIPKKGAGRIIKSFRKFLPQEIFKKISKSYRYYDRSLKLAQATRKAGGAGKAPGIGRLTKLQEIKTVFDAAREIGHSFPRSVSETVKFFAQRRGVNIASRGGKYVWGKVPKRYKGWWNAFQRFAGKAYRGAATVGRTTVGVSRAGGATMEDVLQHMPFAQGGVVGYPMGGMIKKYAEGGQEKELSFVEKLRRKILGEKAAQYIEKGSAAAQMQQEQDVRPSFIKYIEDPKDIKGFDPNALLTETQTKAVIDYFGLDKEKVQSYIESQPTLGWTANSILDMSDEMWESLRKMQFGGMVPRMNYVGGGEIFDPSEGMNKVDKFALDLFTGLIPGIGTIKDLRELYTGKSTFGQEELGTFGKVATGASALLSLLPGIGLVKSAGKAIAGADVLPASARLLKSQAGFLELTPPSSLKKIESVIEGPLKALKEATTIDETIEAASNIYNTVGEEVGESFTELIAKSIRAKHMIGELDPHQLGEGLYLASLKVPDKEDLMRVFYQMTSEGDVGAFITGFLKNVGEADQALQIHNIGRTLPGAMKELSQTVFDMFGGFRGIESAAGTAPSKTISREGLVFYLKNILREKGLEKGMIEDIAGGLPFRGGGMTPMMRMMFRGGGMTQLRKMAYRGGGMMPMMEMMYQMGGMMPMPGMVPKVASPVIGSRGLQAGGVAMMTGMIPNMMQRKYFAAGGVLIPSIIPDTYGMGGMTKIPSYEQGTRFVPSNQLAYLHGGEAVVPASLNMGGLAYQAGGTATSVEIDQEAITEAIKAGIEKATVKAQLDDNVVRLEDNKVQLDPGAFNSLKEGINTAVGTGIDNVSRRVSNLEGSALEWSRAAERHAEEINRIRTEELPAVQIEARSLIHDKTEVLRTEVKDGLANTNSTLSNYESRISSQERNLLEQRRELNETRGRLGNVDSLAQRTQADIIRRP